MCGRFAQYQGALDYVEALSIQLPLSGGVDNIPIARYNVAPQTKVRIIRVQDNQLLLDSVKWGWKPSWANDMQPPINARAETVAASKFYRQIWHHRCLIPADGWFEWMKEGKAKQPYYIHAKNQQPLFFAGIGEFSGNDEHNGFVIITADSKGGMVDIHDRRPIVLTPDMARRWIDPDTSPETAEQILLESDSHANEFDWFAVDPAVGNVRHQGAGLIEPLGDKEQGSLF